MSSTTIGADLTPEAEVLAPEAVEQADTEETAVEAAARRIWDARSFDAVPMRARVGLWATFAGTSVVAFTCLYVLAVLATEPFEASGLINLAFDLSSMLAFVVPPVALAALPLTVRERPGLFVPVCVVTAALLWFAAVQIGPMVSGFVPAGLLIGVGGLLSART